MSAAIEVGRLALVCRPRGNKILSANAGPFLVIRKEPAHVYLQSLTHAGFTLKEHIKNVRPFHLPLAPG